MFPTKVMAMKKCHGDYWYEYIVPKKIHFMVNELRDNVDCKRSTLRKDTIFYYRLKSRLVLLVQQMLVYLEIQSLNFVK